MLTFEKVLEIFADYLTGLYLLRCKKHLLSDESCI